MRLLITILAVLPVGAAAAHPPVTEIRPPTAQLPGADKPCPTLLNKDGTLPPARLWTLDKAPPGRAYHAVYRLDEKGCIDLVTVGYQNRRR